ncbi:MAG: fumarylacetoacetate hydrolase family protein, partial [Acidobacteriota bacterium]
MKIYRFTHDNKTLHGVLREDTLHPVSGSIYKKFSTENRGIPIESVALLAPAVPTKIIAVGVNYRPHASEMRRPLPAEPLIFLKPPSALIGPLGKIIYPPLAGRVDYEGELAVIIKREARRLTAEANPAEYILGYSCFNDVTARDLQAKDIQYTRAKSFDTFAAVGPCIATGLDPSR